MGQPRSCRHNGLVEAPRDLQDLGQQCHALSRAVGGGIASFLILLEAPQGLVLPESLCDRAGQARVGHPLPRNVAITSLSGTTLARLYLDFTVYEAAFTEYLSFLLSFLRGQD